MTPATGATGKPIAMAVPELFLTQFERERREKERRGLADPATCPHSTKTFAKGAWSCKRCGEPL